VVLDFWSFSSRPEPIFRSSFRQKPTDTHSGLSARSCFRLNTNIPVFIRLPPVDGKYRLLSTYSGIQVPERSSLLRPSVVRIVDNRLEKGSGNLAMSEKFETGPEM